MNKTDYDNIQKILRYRRTPVFEKGGELETDYLMSLETSELVKMRNEFSQKEEKENSNKFKSIVKKIFDDYGKPEDNILILSECHGDYDGGRELHNNGGDCFSDPSEFCKINIGRDNTWAQSVEIPKNDDIVQGYYKELWNLMGNLDIYQANYYFEEDEGVNCYWHGFVAVDRGFKIISFVCEDSGDMMSDDDMMGPSRILKKL